MGMQGCTLSDDGLSLLVSECKFCGGEHSHTAPAVLPEPYGDRQIRAFGRVWPPCYPKAECEGYWLWTSARSLQNETCAEWPRFEDRSGTISMGEIAHILCVHTDEYRATHEANRHRTREGDKAEHRITVRDCYKWVPELADLRKRASSWRRNPPDEWSWWNAWIDNVRWRFEQLIGWNREHQSGPDWLWTSRAYSMAREAICKALGEYDENEQMGGYQVAPRGVLLPHRKDFGKVAVRPQPRKPRSIGNGILYRVFERDEYRCRYCGRHVDQLDAGEHLVIDHIHPVSLAGTAEESNLATACSSCNAGKKDHITKRFAAG